MADMNALKARWERYKPILIGFAVGLILGPFISGSLGWQVTGGTMKENVRNAVVSQQASMCEYLARQAVERPDELNYTKRRTLAEKYASFTWDTDVDYSVVSDCTDKLAVEAANGSATPRG